MGLGESWDPLFGKSPRLDYCTLNLPPISLGVPTNGVRQSLRRARERSRVTPRSHTQVSVCITILLDPRGKFRVRGRGGVVECSRSETLPLK